MRLNIWKFIKNMFLNSDTRDEEERAFDKILSMSTTKRILSPSQKMSPIRVIIHFFL